MNVISRWTAGSWFTYNPNNVPGIEYNVQYKNNYNFDVFKIYMFNDQNNLKKKKLQFFIKERF